MTDFNLMRDSMLARMEAAREKPFSTPQQAPSDAVTLTADQAAMLRKVLAAIGADRDWPIGASVVPIPRHLIQEARDALALLPEPVDADEMEAERIAYEMDGGLPRDLVLSVLQAGRALERDSREG